MIEDLKHWPPCTLVLQVQGVRVAQASDRYGLAKLQKKLSRTGIGTDRPFLEDLQPPRWRDVNPPVGNDSGRNSFAEHSPLSNRRIQGSKIWRHELDNDSSEVEQDELDVRLRHGTQATAAGTNTAFDVRLIGLSRECLDPVGMFASVADSDQCTGLRRVVVPR